MSNKYKIIAIDYVNDVDESTTTAWEVLEDKVNEFINSSTNGNWKIHGQIISANYGLAVQLINTE